jgi:hypothetical protein
VGGAALGVAGVGGAALGVAGVGGAALGTGIIAIRRAFSASLRTNAALRCAFVLTLAICKVIGMNGKVIKRCGPPCGGPRIKFSPDFFKTPLPNICFHNEPIK